MRSLLPLTLGLAAIALTCALPSTAQVPPQVVIQRSGDTLGKAHTLNCSGSLECSLASGVATMSTSSNAGDPGVTCPPGYALTYDGSAYTCTANILSASVADSATNANVAAALAMSGPGMLCSGTAAIGIQANGEPICASSITATDLACTGCVSDGEIAGVSGSKVSGAVATASHAIVATQLSANPIDCTGNQWARGIDEKGVPTCMQPAFSNLFGRAAFGQIPADDIHDIRRVLHSNGSGDAYWHWIEPATSDLMGVTLYGSGPAELGLIGAKHGCQNNDILQYRHVDGSFESWVCDAPADAMGRTLTCPTGQVVTCSGGTCACTNYVATSGAASSAISLSCSSCVGDSHISLVGASKISGTLTASRGGTGLQTAPADSVLVGTGSAWVARTIPDCDTPGAVLQYDTATDAFTCRSADAWTNVPAFQGSWINYPSNTSPWSRARYRRAVDGRVHLRGLVTGGTYGTAVFQLPAGYRPSSILGFAAYSAGGHASVTIGSDGAVTAQAGSGFLYLDGISFFPD